MPRKSNFITDSEVPDDHFFDTFGNGVNRKISKENLFNQIKKQAQTYYYDSEDDLKGADLEANPDNPIYVRVAPAWRLYRITSLAPVAPFDIALDNGTTATLDRLENLRAATVDDMKNIPFLKEGDFVETINFAAAQDKGGNTYEIGTFGTADGVFIIDLTATVLQARRMNPVALEADNLQEVKDAPFLYLGDTATTLGYTTAGDGGGNNYEIVAAGTGTDDGGSFIDLSGSGLQARGLFADGGVRIKQFGVDSSALAAINTVAIQNAWNYATSVGVVCYGAPGVFLIERSGNQINSRHYGLLIPDGLVFDGLNKGSCIIKADDGSDMDVVTTNRVSTITDVELKNFTLDGNSANQTSAGGFNFWLHSVNGLRISNVTSIDPESWGYRIQSCNNVFINDVKANHAADVNADGMHFVDTSNVSINGLDIYTEGDDGFIIESLNDDVDDYNVTGLNVRTPVGGVTAARRGIFLFHEDLGASQIQTISNVNINATVSDCDGQGIILSQGQYRNVKITAVVENSLNGLYLDPGSPTFNGNLEGCSFEIDCINPTEAGLIVNENDGLVLNNYINMTVTNPGDGFVGASFRGSNWTGSLRVNYDPFGTKTTFGVGVNFVSGTENDLFIESVDAGTNLLMQGGADDNRIALGNLTGATISNLTNSAGAVNNRFYGGKIETPISLSSSPKFYGTFGADNYGAASGLAPDANGNASIPHGLVASPNYANLQFRTDVGNVFVDVESVDSTDIIARFKTGSGSDVTSGSYAVYWEAKL